MNVTLTALLLLLSVIAAHPTAAAPVVAEAIDVDDVWAGHPVGFALLTDGERGVQYVAYYDADRQMTVASRPLDAADWTRQPLPSRVGWDSHNYIALALDADGHLHVSGNMHNDPLVYFRTNEPGDVTTLRSVEAMTGQKEGNVTYPVFLRGPDGELIFRYRDGGSGNGNEYYNVYDLASRSWSRLLDQPLTDGGGDMNAYPEGPVLGPDGMFHLVWVWRDTPDCATNHDLSYARSRDLRNWENWRGEPLTLPIRIDSPGPVIDPVAPGGGMINGNTKIGFDANDRVIISYHKHDEAGNTQVYNRRLEGDGWVEHQASDWPTRWDFSGGGSIPFELRVSPVVAGPDGRLTQDFSRSGVGSGRWVLSPETLAPVAEKRRPQSHPADLARPSSGIAGVSVKWASDAGPAPAGTGRYVLRWETLPVNRDRPRDDAPPPTRLRLLRLVEDAP